MISITKLLEVKYVMCLKIVNKPTMETMWFQFDYLGFREFVVL